MNGRNVTALRLICFHHAGGDASLFAGWQEHFGAAVQVVAVALPREMQRAPGTHAAALQADGADPSGIDGYDMAALITRLDEMLRGAMAGPHVVYGHSMGGLIGYELVRHRVAAGLAAPRALLVGAFPPPEASQLMDGAELSEDTLVSLLLSSSGLPESVLDHKDWVRKATDVLRADLALLRTHRDRPGGRLPCPVHVFAGNSDPLVSPEGLAEWAARSSVACRLEVLDGGHLFLREDRPAFLERLSMVLADHLPPENTAGATPMGSAGS